MVLPEAGLVAPGSSALAGLWTRLARRLRAALTLGMHRPPGLCPHCRDCPGGATCGRR